MQIALELQLEVKRTTHKHELKRLIVEQLVDEDVLPDSCLEVSKPLPMELSWQFEMRRLEIERELRLKELEAQTQLKKEELEAQKRKEEFEAQQRKEELEAQQPKKELEAQQRKEDLEAQKYEKELELKHEREMRALELNAHRIAHEESIASKFDLGKNVRMATPFNEAEVYKYFQHFELVAQNLWPTDQWPLLLQSILKRHIQLYQFLNVWIITVSKMLF